MVWYYLVERHEGVVVGEEQVEVLERLAKEEALHLVAGVVHIDQHSATTS